MSDGLIDPGQFVCRSVGLDPDGVEASGLALGSLGWEILKRVHGVDRVWRGLRDVYESPEQEAVYGVMKPAVEAATRIRLDLMEASRPIVRYAEALRLLKPRLEAVEVDAWEFRAGVLEEFPDGVGWRVDHDAVARNQDLLAGYNQVHRQVVDEMCACETALRAIGLDGALECVAPSSGLGKEFDRAESYPWGAPEEPAPRNFWESWGYGVRDNVQEFVSGIDALAGYDEFGDHSWETAHQAWGGMGDFLWTHVKVGAGTVPELWSGDLSDEYRGDWNKLLTGWGEGVQWDHQAYLRGENGWQAYVDDPHRAAAKTVSGFIPGVGVVKWVGRFAKKGLPSGVHPVVRVVGAGVERVGQPLVRVRELVRGWGRSGWDRVMGPLDDKLRQLASEVRQGLDRVSGNGWGRAALAGADADGGGRSLGRWGGHGLATVVDEDVVRGGRRGAGGGHGDGDVVVPRRAGEGPVDPPRHGVPDPDGPGALVRTDRHGNPLLVDEHGKPLPEDRGDGRGHFASDPEGTFRDDQGRLRSSVDGARFTEDPYSGNGEVTHFHDWTTSPVERGWDDPARQAEFTQTSAAWREVREVARRARSAARDSLDFAREWLTRTDPKVKIDTKGYSTLADMLEKKLKTATDLTDADRAALRHHRELLKEAGDAELELRKASEWAGDRGGHLILEDQGRRVILGETGGSPGGYRSPGSGTLDQVGIGGPDIDPPTRGGPRSERYEIVFDENKGGNSPKMGSRQGAQQGTLPYLRDLLSSSGDSRLAARLAVLRDAGEFPGFFEALRRGEVVVRYQFVNARPDGTLRAGEFNLGSEVRLRWDGGDTFDLITD